ncbi:hypothetical protein SAMN05216223_12780 [Actinacidiphila yanglinensis]|uniref:DUF1440 domain-containing protein n=2 Tax=Actinacidiphila yanglinensis TaxID=310779 RepID=A0A1H6E6L9_9ACTN|nr:hypothetical protein SAMN05216223_12780 [Actinacidiphila yanglinensis]
MGTLLRGTVAGAAGTTVLNAVTYGDMAVRGRPTSSAPEGTVEALADLTGVTVGGTGETRGNRLTGLGALSGIVTGVGVGTAVAVLRKAGVRLPLWMGGVLTGALAMAVTDLSMAELDVSDPRTWSGTDWLSDAIPHLIYGLVTYGIMTAGEQRT